MQRVRWKHYQLSLLHKVSSPRISRERLFYGCVVKICNTNIAGGAAINADFRLFFYTQQGAEIRR